MKAFPGAVPPTPRATRSVRRLVALALAAAILGACGGDSKSKPVLTSVMPATASSLGGWSVTLSGRRFQTSGTTEVLFDGVPATNVVVIDNWTLVCDTPPGTPAASVDVKVRNERGSARLTGGFAFHALPTLQSVTAPSGTSLGATSVTIQGTGFLVDGAGVTAVTFGGTVAANVVLVDDTNITCDTPPGVPATSVDVSVWNQNGAASLPAAFAYHPEPALASLFVASGTSLGGTLVTLRGSGFLSNGAGTNTVRFDGVPATNVVVVDDTNLSCQTPAGTQGATVDVDVSNANGTDTLAASFSFHPTPTVTGVAPVAGTAFGGTAVTLTGSGFAANGAGANAVTLGGVPATNVVVVDDGTITCSTPPGPPAVAVDVVVGNANGTGTLSAGFAYHPTPALGSVVPASGTALGGTSVTLGGSGFLNNGAGANTVTFDGIPATSVVVVDDTTITCDVPAGTPATSVEVVVSNANGTGTLSAGFAYHPTPSLASVVPASGTSLGGTSVTLGGSGFVNNGAGANAVTVDGIAATNVVVVDDTTITCGGPAGAPGAGVDVVVSNANGTGTLSAGFTYHPTPALGSVVPASGSSLGGASVTLGGSGFLNNGAGANTVTFDGNAATNVVVVDDTSITCDVPVGTPSTSVDVVVSNLNGTGTLAGGFAYHPEPTLVSVVPPSGPAGGGTMVTLTGTGFQANGAGTNAVTFDGNAATNVLVVDDTSITCDVPAGVPATSVDVVVSNANGVGTLSAGFAYHPEPTLASVLPASGTSLGGTSVTLGGSGFVNNGAGAGAVTFGGNPATSVVVVDDTTITCDTPSGSGGAADVLVSNANGVATLAGGFTYLLAPDASASSVVAVPSFGTLADGVDTTTVTVTVRDGLGTPISGETVVLSVTGTANAIVQPGPTNASGVATGTITSTAAETKTISAKVAPGPSEVVLDDRPAAKLVWPAAGVYYVRKGGSDANAGTGPNAAWLTLAKAVATVGAGDTVYFGAGVYQESVELVTGGTSGGPIRLVADTSGERAGDAGEVVVDALGLDHGLKINAAPHVWIEGLSFVGATGGGSSAGLWIEGDASDSVRVRSVRSFGNSLGVFVQDADDFLAEEVSVSNNLVGGMSFDATDDATVRGALIYNNAGEGLHAKDPVNLQVEGSTFFLNTGTNLGTEGAGSATVRDSLLTDGGGAGIFADVGVAVTSSYNDAWNNAGGNWVGTSMGVGDLSADPGYANPPGPDGLLGGAEGEDDELHLAVAGPAVDVGSQGGAAVLFADGSSMADRTTRLDGILDGTAPDGAAVNLGYHYPPAAPALPALEDDDARLAYAEGTLSEPRIRTWDDSASAWSGEGEAHPGGRTTRWVVGGTSSLDDGEDLFLTLSDTGSGTELDLVRWSGTSWGLDGHETGIDAAHAGFRGLDLAFEEASGDALVVYSDGSPTPVYRARSQGVWSDAASLPLNDGGGPNPDPNGATVRWIELVPRPGTGEIALVYADDANDLVAIVWDGTQWLTASATTLDAGLKQNGNTGLVDNRCFDAAYEAATGHLLVAWGRLGQNGFVWSRKDAGATSWSAPVAVGGGFGDESDFLDLASEPGGRRVAAVFCDLEGSPERLTLATWDGAGWVDVLEVDPQMRDANASQPGDFPAAVSWLGTSGVALCVYADNATGNLDWIRWSAGGGWVLQADVPIAGKGFTESLVAEGLAGTGRVLVVLSDANGDLFAAFHDGTAWSVTNGGTPLETSLPALDAVPFALGVER